MRRCRACSLVFLYPHPGPAEMIRRHTAREYAEHPYFKAGEEVSEEGGLELHHLLLADLTSRLSSGARVLDVGAGTGDFLRLAATKFEVAGIEPSAHLAERIRRRVSCPVFVCSVEEFDAQEEYDAIVLLDIIEHVADPRQLLRRVHAFLKPGGLILVSTVDSRSTFFRLGPLFWKLSRFSKTCKYILERIYSYQHNWYFNTQVLRNLVEETRFEVLKQEGFEFPTNRLKEGAILTIGLRCVYLVNRLVGQRTEQYLFAKKSESGFDSRGM